MNDSILKRIERIEALIKNKCGLFTVYYKDGRTDVVNAGDIIDLTLERSDEIERFEEHKPKQHNGLLEELCNDLLTL